jgi:hypothetical protein
MEPTAQKKRRGSCPEPLGGQKGSMIVEIRPRHADDRTFLLAVNGLVARLVNEFEPERICAVRLNKWFDHKWLGYSGKGRVAFPYGYPYVDTALDEHYQKELTLPPFNPKQVITESHWERNREHHYSRLAKPKPVHRRILEHSSANLHRRIGDRWSSAVFMWFSSNTASNEHGCVMVYVVTPQLQSTWYASFTKTRGWRVNRVKGIAKERVQEWFPLG